MSQQQWSFPMFCPNCDSIVSLDDKQGFCTCPDCKRKIPMPQMNRQLTWQHVERFSDNRKAVASETKSQESGVTVKRKCFRCGHDLMSYSTRQTRSADEGMTVFFTCLKCGEKEIEHS
uniref:DNA-directed RNA polymerase subunit n=1 Tax=Trichuris muris TaxID=70415 RepID=A0A5S6QXS1_TRIMR